MSGLCRVDAYQVITATLVGGSFDVVACDLPATQRVSVTHSAPGLGVDVQVDTCNDHASQIEDHDDGFIRARSLALISP